MLTRTGAVTGKRPMTRGRGSRAAPDEWASITPFAGFGGRLSGAARWGETRSSMTFFDGLPIIDIRDRLPHADWRIGTRPATTSLTIHWNGPAVPDDRRAGPGVLAQLQIDAAYQMRAGWGGTVGGAPGLMYHFVIDADGKIYQTSGIDEILWHCAHADGNTNGLSLHYLLGLNQYPTSAQLDAGRALSDALRRRYAIPLARVLGHLEWRHMTLCPGPILMQQLQAYRAGAHPNITPTPTPPGCRRFQIRTDLLAPANVRQGPGTTFPVAGRMKSGTVLWADVVKIGQPIEGNPRWCHMARVGNEQADLGFVSETLGVWI